MSTSTATPSGTGRPSSKLRNFRATYHKDHQHPVNHVLHVGVGWPMCALAVLLLPFRPWWSVALVAGAYGFMWFGHFVFERNLPTIFKHPTTPFVMAWIVSRDLLKRAVGLVRARGAR